MLGGSNAEDVAGALQTLTKIEYREDDQSWHIDDATVQFSKDGYQAKAKVDNTEIELSFQAEVGTPQAFDDWPEMKAKQIERAELEKQLTRGARRALEVLAPSKLLRPVPINAKRKSTTVNYAGSMDNVWSCSWYPEEIGTAHGKLLRQEANRCIVQ